MMFTDPDGETLAPKPMLHGMNPERLLDVLKLPPDPPEVPGWRILGMAGEGGLGTVWKAARETDGVEGALKIADGADLNTVERIESEAAALRGLRHPNIVPLIETGPLSDGGIYLAMQFISGTTLAQAIPPEGLPPKIAFSIFRKVAEAVSYAHSQGILHRDLKPANILLALDLDRATDGITGAQPMVADFGLARAVHERVEHLSLTQTGLIAGTVEYLPPEAYHRGYQPTVSGDVYALGVILYEMLMGTPPRGAWAPISETRRVDIRVDDVLRKALHPDPAQRWENVAAMDAALRSILDGFARYSGTPRVTLATRVADCIWTVLGLGLSLVLLFTLIRLDKSMIPVPVDLIGKHSRKIGGFQALFYLLQVLGVLCVWQLARLWRFRRVPMREALPSPFGLRLGNSRTAAVLVGVTQFFCLLLPIHFLYELYKETGQVWVRSGDGPWADGLTVTVRLDAKGKDGEARTPLSPWVKPKKGYTYYLKHVGGPPDQPSGYHYDRIGFIPFYIPAEMVAIGSLAGITVFTTLGFAVVHWWLRKRRIRSLATVGSGYLVGVFIFGVFEKDFAAAAWHRKADQDTWYTRAFMPGHASDLIKHYIAQEPSGLTPFPPDLVAHFSPMVDYREHGRIPREKVAEAYRVDIEHARAEKRTMWNTALSSRLLPPGPDPKRREVHVFLEWVEMTDPSPADPAQSEAGILARAVHCMIKQEGFFSLSAAVEPFQYHRETLYREPIYEAACRSLTQEEANRWHRAFLAALGTPLPAAQKFEDALDPAEPLLTVFHGGFLHFLNRNIGEGRHDGPMNSKRNPSYRCKSAIWDLRRNPGLQSTGPVVSQIERLPGGRSRIQFPMRDARGVNITFHADLAHIGGSWRCVQFFTES